MRDRVSSSTPSPSSSILHAKSSFSIPIGNAPDPTAGSQILTVLSADNTAFLSFIVAGSDDTTHVRAALGRVVSGTVALDTKVIGRIEGLQFKGEFMRASELEEKIYFKRFPYAIPMKPQIFSVKLSWIKFTSNTLGFGKKIIWNRA